MTQLVILTDVLVRICPCLRDLGTARGVLVGDLACTWRSDALAGPVPTPRVIPIAGVAILLLWPGTPTRGGPGCLAAGYGMLPGVLAVWAPWTSPVASGESS